MWVSDMYMNVFMGVLESEIWTRSEHSKRNPADPQESPE